MNGKEAIHSLYSISVGRDIREIGKWRDGEVGVTLKCLKKGSQNFNEAFYGWQIVFITNF